MSKLKYYNGTSIRLDRRGLFLTFKFWWYKYICRLDIVGFYNGIPLIRTKYLTPPW